MRTKDNASCSARASTAQQGTDSGSSRKQASKQRDRQNSRETSPVMYLRTVLSLVQSSKRIE